MLVARGSLYGSILFGLASAFGFGVGDLCARTAGRHVGTFRAMFYGGLQGLFVLSLWIGIDHRSWPLTASLLAWGAAVLAGCLNLAATFALFRAFAKGKLALVAPVVASYGAVTVVLSLISGESVTAVRAVGVVCTVLGVVFACAVPTHETTEQREGTGPRLAPGLGAALLAAGGYGTTFWVLGTYAIPQLGSLVPVWIYYATEVAALVLIALPRGISLRMPARNQMPVVIGNGLCIAVAYVLFALGLGSGSVAIVTVLSSLSSAVTVLGAALFLGERLVARQWAGAVAILIGLLFINSDG